MTFHFVLLIVFSIVLAFSTNLVIKAIKKLSQTTGLNQYSLANVFLALGTSLPELLIGIEAALANQPSLSLGNVIGSNIADLSVVIGGATLLGGILKVKKNILKTEIYHTFLIAAAPLVLLIDGQLSRIDGLLLLILFLFWQITSFKANQERNYVRIFNKNQNQTGNNKKLLSLTELIIGLSGLILASNQLVESGKYLAGQFKIPPLIIGIFIIGLGSSLPELALETKAIKKRESEVALGDLLGSIAINSSLIVGITAVIKTINLAQPRIYLTATLFFLITFFVFYLFIRTRSILERWEGAILLMLYFVLVAIELL